MATSMFSGILAMAIVVLASNVLVQFPLLDSPVTWGAFSYPLAFLVTDLMNRMHGPAEARRVVFAGFAVGLACSLAGSLITLEFGPAVPMRIGVASVTAFLVAHLMNVAVFDRLRSGNWWRAPLASTIVGSVIDTLLFFSLAFSASIAWFGPKANAAVAWASEPEPFLGTGPIAPLWVSLAFADWIVKLAMAIVALIPFRLLSARSMNQAPVSGRPANRGTVDNE